MTDYCSAISSVTYHHYFYEILLLLLLLLLLCWDGREGRRFYGTFGEVGRDGRTRAHTNTGTHTHARTHTYTHTYTHIHAYTHARMHTHISRAVMVETACVRLLHVWLCMCVRIRESRPI